MTEEKRQISLKEGFQIIYVGTSGLRKGMIFPILTSTQRVQRVGNKSNFRGEKSQPSDQSHHQE
jgi:hypothetical protein